jgi:catalase
VENSSNAKRESVSLRKPKKLSAASLALGISKFTSFPAEVMHTRGFGAILAFPDCPLKQP